MANAKEVEIVNSLRSQGYTSDQIVGAIRQHRHNVKVEAERRRRKRAYEKQLKEKQEQQKLAQESIYDPVTGTTFVPKENEDGELKWHQLNDDNSYTELDEKQLKILGKQVEFQTGGSFFGWGGKEIVPGVSFIKEENKLQGNVGNFSNALNKYKYKDFKVVDGEWKINNNDGTFQDLNLEDNEELITNLDVLYPRAKEHAAKRKDGKNARNFTYNLIDVEKAKEINELKAENEKRQNTSYEEWLANDEYFYDGKKKPGFWGQVGEGISFGMSKVTDAYEPTYDYKGNEIQTFRREEYEEWRDEILKEIPSNVSTKSVNPDAYRINDTNENIMTMDGVVKPGEYYIAKSYIKQAEDKGLDISNKIIKKEEYDDLLLNRNREKASTDPAKIEEHWGYNYDGDYSLSEIVQIGLENDFTADGFKEGTYKLDGQTYEVKYADVDMWQEWKKHNDMYKEGGGEDQHREMMEEIRLEKEKKEEDRQWDISAQLSKLGDSPEDKRRYNFLINELDKDGEVYQKEFQENASSYFTWIEAKNKIDGGGLSDKEIKYQEYVMEQNSDWKKMFGSEDGAQFAINNKLVNQSISSKLDFSNEELGDIEDMDDFEEFLKLNYGELGLYNTEVYDKQKGKWVFNNPINSGNVWSGGWDNNKLDVNKANLLNAYYNQQSKKILDLENEYESNGFYEKVDELDKLDLELKENLNQLNEEDPNSLYSKYLSLKEKIESGEVESSEENINKLNELVDQVNIISDESQRISKRYNYIVNNPRTKMLMEGYEDFANQANLMKLKYNNLYKNNKAYRDMIDNQKKIEKASEHWSAPYVAPIEEVFGTIIDGAISGVSFLAVEGTDLFFDIDKKRKGQMYELFETASNMLRPDMVQMGPLFDPKTGDFNFASMIEQSAQTLTLMHMMVKGGGVVRSGVSNIGSKARKISSSLPGQVIKNQVALNLPRLYGGIKAIQKSKIIPSLGNIGKGLKLKDRAQQVVGGAMQYYPMNVEEAMSQVDDDFTVEDAFNSALTKTMFESGIEALFPDVSMFKNFSKIKGVSKKQAAKLTDDFLNPKLWLPKDGIIPNLKTFTKLFGNVLKEVPKELIEENLQELANGMVSIDYNKNFGTDFHVPTEEDFKALNILTPATVFFGGAIRSKGFRKGQIDASMYQAAIENIDLFQEVMRNKEKLGQIKPGEANKIIQQVQSYILAKSKIDFDEYNSMSYNQRQETLNVLVRKEQLEKQIKDTKNPAEKQRLQRELNNTESYIKKLAKQVNLNFKSKEETQLDFDIWNLKQDAKKYELGSKEYKDIRKKILKKLKERNQIRLEASPYEFQGKSYESLSEFISDIRRAKQNGFFDKQNRGNLKINNKVGIEKAQRIRNIINSITGIDNFVGSEVLMSQTDAIESQEFQALTENRGKTLADFEAELKELLRAPGGRGGRGLGKEETSNLINDLRNTINYLKLVKKGFEFDQQGVITATPEGVTQAMIEMDGGFDFKTFEESEFDNAVKSVRDLTDKSGVITRAMTREEIIANGFHETVPGSLNNIAFMSTAVNSKTGKVEPILIINKDVSLESKNFTGASHELLHQVLFSVINGPMRQVVDKNGKKYNTRLTEKGKDLIQGLLELLPENQRADLEEVMEARGYITRDQDGEIIEPFEYYAEEYLNSFHDIVVGGITLYNEDGSVDRVVKFDNRPENRNILQRFRDKIVSFFKEELEEDLHGVIDTSLDTPEKLLEFLRTYNSQAIDGKFSEDILNMSIGSKVYYSEVVDEQEAVVSFSRAQQNVQQEIDALMTPQTAAELAQEVNDLYNDDTISDSDKEFLIASKYRGMAELRWRAAYNKSLGTSSQQILETFKDDIISEMLFDLGTKKVDKETGKEKGRKARTVIGLVRDFKTEKQAYGNLAAYINTFFKVRAFKVLSDFTKDKGFARSMQDAMNEVSRMEEASSQLDEAKGIQSGGIVVSERLLAAEKGTDREQRIKNHIANLNKLIDNNPEIAEGKNYKSLPDLDPRGTVSIMMSDPTAVYKDDGSVFWTTRKGKKLLGTSILDSIVKKLANNDNLTQQDIKQLQPYISKHQQLLWTGLPKGFTTKRVKQRDGSFIDRPDKSVGVQNVLLEPFYNKASKPYGNFFPQTKKPNVFRNEFLGVFGITPRLEVNIVGKESNVSQRVKALIVQHGKVISNQTTRQNENTTDAVRNALENGKSAPLYSKAVANAPQQTTNYLQAVAILDRTIPWGEFMSMSIGPSNLKIKEIPGENMKLLRNYIKTALVEAGVDKSLHSDIIKEMTAETGVVISQINLRNSYKGSKEVFPSIVDQARQYWEQEAIEERSVFNALGIEGTYKSIANQQDVITRARQSITDSVVVAMRHAGMNVDGRGDTLLQDIWKQSTVEQKEKALSYIFKTKGQFAASGKIVDGFWTVEYEGGPVIKNKKHIPNKGRMGMQITEGVGDWAALINKALPGIEIIPVKPKMEKGKPKMRTNSHITRQPTVTDDKRLKEMYPNFSKVEISENSNEVIEKLNPDLSYKNFNKHKEQALSYRAMLTDQFIAFYNSYSDQNSLVDDRDAATYIMTLSSGMTSPTRKAAYPWGISDNAKNVPVKDRGTKLEYDHLKPNNVLMLKLANMLKRNLTEAEIRAELDVFFSDYVVNIIQKKMDGVVKMNKMQSHMQLEYVEGTDLTDLTKLEQSALGRLFHKLNKYNKEIKAITALDPELKGLRVGEDFVNKSYHNFENIQEVEQRNVMSKAVNNARQIDHTTPSRGMSAFDFDETLIDKGENTIIATKGDDVVEISSSNWPLQGPQLAADGYEFDFSDFVNVKGGVEGPLMQKFRNRIAKYGIENNYILTARPAESAPAIQAWLKTQGIDMPIENITGLGNSTGEAKAMWMAQKYAEGYNDMYFVDDALPNVEAVKDMMEQLDIKGSSVQAKIQFSRAINPNFNRTVDSQTSSELDLNRIIEQTTGEKAEKRYSEAQAKVRGSKKGKWSFFVPPSAEDFKGLLYRLVGKGRIGEQHMAFFKKALFDPFSRAITNINRSTQQVQDSYRQLLKTFPDVKRDLNSKIKDFDGSPNVNFTVDNAVRVYLWNKAGFEIPGLSQRDLNALVEFVESNQDVKDFANNLSLLVNQEQAYVQPNDYWLAETIQSDLQTLNNQITRDEHLAEFKENRAKMFGEWQGDRLVGPNMNKLEAIYGTRYREALEDMLYRMEYGRKREKGSNRLVNAFNNWANQSVGAIMFFNMRSALLQTISSINYINWSDNNPLKAAIAFANQPQFWKDFSMIFNSDMLKQRRAGNQRGINEAELAAAVAGSDNKAKAALNWLLTKGFLPTQIADSFAIASGGATFYRNRVNSYLKQGLSKQDAEARAFKDFQETTEESQQSSRPDMISQQQASPLGRYILAFKNTPMQYARLMKKAWLDIANGRGDFKSNLSKILYYGMVQNLIFNGLQAALGAMIGDDDEEEQANKNERIINGMIDSVLGGLGFGGNAVVAIKNTLFEYLEQRDKKWGADHTYTMLQLVGFSPTVGSKLRKIYSGIQTEKFNREVIKEMGPLDIDNPAYGAIANVISGLTNVPLDRLVKKVDNIDAAITEDITMAERLALLLGWNTWDLGIEDQDILAVEEEIKEKKDKERKEKREQKKLEDKKKKEEENKIKEEENKKKDDNRCIAITRGGSRCKNEAIADGYCTIHAKVEQGTKEVQCSKIKSDGKRCKMKTKAKSGLCYYHD